MNVKDFHRALHLPLNDKSLEEVTTLTTKMTEEVRVLPKRLIQDFFIEKLPCYFANLSERKIEALKASNDWEQFDTAFAKLLEAVEIQPGLLADCEPLQCVRHIEVLADRFFTKIKDEHSPVLLKMDIKPEDALSKTPWEILCLKPVLFPRTRLEGIVSPRLFASTTCEGKIREIDLSNLALDVATVFRTHFTTGGYSYDLFKFWFTANNFYEVLHNSDLYGINTIYKYCLEFLDIQLQGGKPEQYGERIIEDDKVLKPDELKICIDAFLKVAGAGKALNDFESSLLEKCIAKKLTL